MGRVFNACVALYCGLVVSSILEKHAYRARMNHELHRSNQLPEAAEDVILSGLAQLSMGKTFFRMEGNAKSDLPLVVLIHGFVGCHKDFDPLVSHLKKSGRRILRMDNYGRGWSSLTRVEVRDSPEVFASQIAEVLHYLNESDPVDLVGYSMGGGITAYYSAVYGPSKVASLALLAPAGLPPTANAPWLVWLSQALYFLSLQPYGENGLVILARRLVEKLLSKEALGFEKLDETEIEYLKFSEDRMKNEVQLPYAVVKTITEYPTTGLNFAFEAVAQHKIPTLALWSKTDESVSFKCKKQLDSIYAAAGAEIKTYVFEDQGHKFPLVKAGVVANQLHKFWSRK